MATAPAAPEDPPFDGLNETFHARYDTARKAATQEPPVCVLLVDALVSFIAGERKAYALSPRPFEIIKAITHGPVALYVSLTSTGDHAALSGLAAHLTRTREALAGYHDAALDRETRADLEDLLTTCLSVIDAAQKGAVDGAAVDAFAAHVGPSLLRLAEAATRIQLAALHEATERVFAELSPAQRRSVHIVVTGDHQARVRSLGMQYFRKRMGESEGEETRVTFAEGVSDEHEARTLVATQRLDRGLARAFFGDEKRLQRDILGDAAKRLLAEFVLPPEV